MLVELAYETGLTKVFLPEFDEMMHTVQNNPHHCYTVGEHTIAALQQVESDKILRLTMLFHDVAKPSCRTTDAKGVDHFYGHELRGSEMTRQILHRLKFDNDTTKRVCSLILCHDDMPKLEDKYVRRAIFKNGLEQYPALFAVKRADVLAQSDYKRQEKLLDINRYEALYLEILNRQQCLCIKDLAITGADLIALGMQPGKKLGETLKKLLELVLEQPELNTKEKLIEQVHKLENPFI